MATATTAGIRATGTVTGKPSDRAARTCPGGPRGACRVRRDQSVAAQHGRPAARKKGRLLEPASCFVASGGSHHPAGRTELAFTRRAMPLVVAPQEHPPQVKLRLKREAGLRAQRTDRHATPLTEALHVPLHLDSVLVSQPRRRHRHVIGLGRLLSRRMRSAGSSGLGWDRAGCAGTKAQELLAAAPSMSASLPVILQCVLARTSSFGMPASRCGERRNMP